MAHHKRGWGGTRSARAGLARLGVTVATPPRRQQFGVAFGKADQLGPLGHVPLAGGRLLSGVCAACLIWTQTTTAASRVGIGRLGEPPRPAYGASS
ncbi:hypothetical protein MRX96_009753 [Rhipicephalus microplus]